jgi:hypothetical protein
MLDLTLTLHSPQLDKCKCLPPLGKSDHVILLLDTLITPQRSKPVKRKIYLWDKADQEWPSGLTQIFTTKTYANIDDMWITIKNFTTDFIDRHIATKMSSSKNTNPWANRHIEWLSRRKQRAHTKAERTKHPRNWKRYKSLQVETQREIKQAHGAYMDKVIIGDMQENSKRLWSYLNSRKQDTSGVAPLPHNDRFLHNDAVTKANILKSQFHSPDTHANSGEISIPIHARH